MADTDMERTTHLLALPYDIRCLIYAYLFPTEPQIYLAANRNQSRKMSLYPMHAREDLSMTICQVSQQLNAEVAGYVYNNYLFNVVGTKQDIMTIHRNVSKVMAKYARTEVQTNVLDNGPLSSTACVSIYVSGGRVERKAARRHRGVLRDLKEVEDEVAMMSDSHGGWIDFKDLAFSLLGTFSKSTRFGVPLGLMAICVAIAAVCLTLVLSAR